MSKNKVSITFTALIWTGILLSLCGAIVAVLGFGGSTFVEASIGSIKLKMTQTGLIILIVGALLSYFTAINLPKGVTVLADEPTFAEKIVREIPIISLSMSLVSVILLVFLFFSK
jgi:hypothetical protein